MNTVPNSDLSNFDLPPAEPAAPRKTPCASCPYRKGVPSGIWHPDEYSKLPAYDNEMHEQPLNPFSCHHSDGNVCAGWLGYRDPADLIAVRIGVIRGKLAAECIDYKTRVPLFESGESAAEHGMEEVRNPSPEAREAIGKIAKLRSFSGRPVIQ